MLEEAEGVGEGELDFAVCAPSDNGKIREATIAPAREVLDFINLGLWTGSAKLSAAVRGRERRLEVRGLRSR